MGFKEYLLNRSPNQSLNISSQYQTRQTSLIIWKKPITLQRRDGQVQFGLKYHWTSSEWKYRKHYLNILRYQEQKQMVQSKALLKKRSPCFIKASTHYSSWDKEFVSPTPKNLF